ncbi:MAG TPA: VWA domain-containing protein [Pyrinomonadaceae bacterium]|jgi:Ca-activated chloride channel family protein|nr:VWA domain-containing protein [Pyrinomonadaceae bacterium]
MKRAFGLVSLLLLICCSAYTGRGQTIIDMPPPPPPPVLRPAAKPQVVQPVTPVPEKEPEFEENDVVRVSTNLITVPAEVIDRNGRNVSSLQKTDFRIYENGVEQQVSYFASVEQPFTVALLLDVSGSTQSQLQAIRTAANTFIKRLRPNDRLLLVSFDGRINVLTEAVTLAELRKQKLRLDAIHDGTLLYDTVGFVLNQRLAAIPGRKAIVLMTDGVDNGSKQASLKQNLRDAEEANVVIYTVQYNTMPQLPARLSQISNLKAREHVRTRMVKDYGVGSTYLQFLAEKTGGRIYRADDLADVPQVFSNITDELGRQYSLGYYPKGQAQPGEKRDIKVQTRVPNLIVRARESYVATAKVSTNRGQD